MSDWVRFDRQLVRGSKRSIPRALRFVLMELCLEARPKRGIVELPVDVDTVRAVQDLLGGNKKEVASALKTFTCHSDPDQNPVKVERNSSVHRLIVTSWDQYNGGSTSTERVQRHRASKENGNLAPVETFHRNVTGETAKRPTVQTGQTEQTQGGNETPPDESPEAHRATAEETERESGYALAIRVFLELWQAKYRTPYTLSPNMGQTSEHRHLQRLGNLVVDRDGDRAEESIRRLFSAYLRDPDPWLAQERHPARGIEARLNKYATTPREEPSGVRRLVSLPDEPILTREQAEATTAALRARNALPIPKPVLP